MSMLRDLLTTDRHLHPVYQRAARDDLPVVVHTNNKDVIAHVVALKRETDAHLVIMGGAEAHLVAAELAAADVPVIVSPFWGCERLFFDGRHCLPGPPLTDALGPQALLAAGVRVAIANWDDTNNHIRNSIWEAGWLFFSNPRVRPRPGSSCAPCPPQRSGPRARRTQTGCPRRAPRPVCAAAAGCPRCCATPDPAQGCGSPGLRLQGQQLKT